MTLIRRAITYSQFFIRCVTPQLAFLPPSHVNSTAASAPLVAYSYAPPRNRPHGFRRCRTRRDMRHRTSRFRLGRRPPQQMDRRGCVHAQAIHRCSLKPHRPTTSRPTATSRATTARPRALQCCPSHLTRPPRRHSHSLNAVHLLAERAVFQVYWRDWCSPLAGTRREVLPPPVGCRRRLRWDCEVPGLGAPSFGNFPPTPRSPLSGLIRLRRGIRRRMMTRKILVERMYDAVLRASAFLLVIPTKILCLPSCLNVAMTPYRLFVILYIERGRFTITVLA